MWPAFSSAVSINGSVSISGVSRKTRRWRTWPLAPFNGPRGVAALQRLAGGCGGENTESWPKHRRTFYGVASATFGSYSVAALQLAR